MTEDELLDAGLGAGEHPTGVPLVMHQELRELRTQLDAVAREVATSRELLELLLALQGVDPSGLRVRVQLLSDLAPCPACHWIASHADDCPREETLP